MSQVKINKFTSFELTKEEAISGAIFNIAQLQSIQNLLSEAAEMKVELVFDPLNPVDFAQQVSYQQGKIDVLSYLIENSAAVQNEIAFSGSQEQDNSLSNNQSF